MTEGVYVNADRSKVVDGDSPEAAFHIHLRDARRLGLLPETTEPEPAPVELHLTPPKAKQEEPAEDKQAAPARNKSRRRRGSK